MELDRLTAAIRPRGNWEAQDLGFALARRWFPALWGLWWLGALAPAALGAIWLWDRPDLWLLLVWWLKPVYEAPLLFWLSRALFGEPLSPAALWRERRRMLPARLVPYLLWRRLAASRSFQLPLVLLEGLGGQERRRRQRVLQGRDGSPAWLTIICLHLESILWLSALLLVGFLVPDRLPGLDLERAMLSVGSGSYWASALLYLIAMSVIAPFYVAAGFASYLTRRIELEAWDLELAFRRGGVDDRQRHPHRARVRATLALLVPILLLAPWEPAPAQQPSPEQARELVDKVLAGEEFHSRKEVRAWVYTGADRSQEDQSLLPTWWQDLVRFFAEGSVFGAGVLKWTLVLLVVILVALALPRILSASRGRRNDRSPATDPPREPRGLALADGGPPPAEVPALVRARIARGDPRGALSLLYRAGLMRLSAREGVAIPRGATESECLALLERVHPPEETAFLPRLIQTWQRVAYAHQIPQPTEIASLLGAWDHWYEKRNGA